MYFEAKLAKDYEEIPIGTKIYIVNEHSSDCEVSLEDSNVETFILTNDFIDRS